MYLLTQRDNWVAHKGSADVRPQELPAEQIEALRTFLGYPKLAQKFDRANRDYWYLRPGADVDEAENTAPIAVRFYDDLESKQEETYKHYLGRNLADKPVMYLLLPNGEDGKVSLVLPTEGGLKQRNIQNFEIDSPELRSRLERLKQGTLPVAHKAMLSIPLAEFAFYKPLETAKDLAQQLATVAKRIEQIIPQVYRDEKSEQDGYLHKLLKSFQQELLPFLKLEAENDKDYSFADIYAQTVAYSLFTARVFSHLKWQKDLQVPTVKEPLFDRASAWEQLPETNPFLRQLFKDISERQDLGDELITEIANIFGILRAAKMEAILSDFSQTGNRDDIIIHFYEPFLAAYNPKLKDNRGVYYTPESVVSYMVRSVDILLKDKFHKPLGLADPDVMILDPATGTGTYLLWIFQLVERRFKGTDGDVESQRLIKERFGEMSWTQYVRDHLLPRVAGFELLMAPYAIAHLKLSLFLQESGYEFDPNQRLAPVGFPDAKSETRQRLKVYLTNTLDNAPRKSEFLFDEFIASEANEATSIKQDEPVMVVVGNPPYSGHSENKGEWISNLLKDYYQVDGQPLGEKNPKYLQDDYVKFIRFSQWRIQKTGMGILAFITNHGYLDNPTFRGMRRSLDQTFDEMYIFDLHGNSKKKEVAPDGSKDENIFDIQQGVAIGLMVKLP
ncbi:N-6 DNA methylase [Chamaesiphon sp. VAR_48_metabat_135_sub]|uniref:N-6 DNA methylase n=1 Tax=Chamaesiphon sp. VAR_48_metabat_135_sub TaxID=2964699 RepID=UPI00286D35AA|nr:N-6 DNA methylase [Chamaesiphon sp. VAR_48_metabat_135_sub]